MAMKILSEALPETGELSITLPEMTRALSVNWDDSTLKVYFLYDETSAKVTVRVWSYAEGEQLPDQVEEQWEFIGSAFHPGTKAMRHYFLEREAIRPDGPDKPNTPGR